MSRDPIYQAQCFGNVEPIEYMVPYPNLRSLAVGQCIKFSKNILFKESNLTNVDFLKSINNYSNWLAGKNIKKGDCIFVTNIPSPLFDIISYSIWSLGAVLIISDVKDIGNLEPKLVIDSIEKLDYNKISDLSEEYITTSNILLNDNAVIFYHQGKGIVLSHYNLLINAYGIVKELNLLYNNSIQIDIPKENTTYLVLNTILPLYAGTTITEKNADIVFGTNTDANYQIQFEWKKLSSTNPQSLYVLPEATAILSIGLKPNHLLSIQQDSKLMQINGHSVMMGYVDEKENAKVFKSGSLVLPI